MKPSKITTKVKDGKLVIEVPLDLLKYAIENHPEEPLKVRSKLAMAHYFANHILEHESNVEAGPDLERLLDAVAFEAYESAEGWIVASNSRALTYRE